MRNRGGAASSSSTVIFDFVSDPSAVSRWYAQDDRVMGGVSQSRLVSVAGGAAFEGFVSLEQNGGFASIRSRPFVPPLDLLGASGLVLTVRGDGQRYKLVLRNEEGLGAPSFMAGFDTVPQIAQRIALSWRDFVATFRGRPANAHLDCARVSSCGLMRSKVEADGSLWPRFSPGAFRLEVLTLESSGREP